MVIGYYHAHNKIVSIVNMNGMPYIKINDKMYKVGAETCCSNVTEDKLTEAYVYTEAAVGRGAFIGTYGMCFIAGNKITCYTDGHCKYVSSFFIKEV